MTSTIRPKKVAIIGAGPSGLVAAKTLLHNFPKGTFSPTIFEKSHEIGGLWPSDIPAGDSNGPRVTRAGRYVDPLMRTNLSRFTVSFSDLSWDSVIDGPDVPTFPQAWQVGLYLKKYMQRYIPGDVLRLGHRVIRSVRETGGSWTIQWVLESEYERDNSVDRSIASESFDYLIVASGYFSQPHIPDIPGLDDYADRTVHSSALHTREDIRLLLEKSGKPGKLVVIGGSMSGVETASALALHLSSQHTSEPRYEVHHVCSRPFWIMPTYLPRTTEHTVQFLPLDLVLYDLSRRPPGRIEYTFGPLSPHQTTKTNAYLSSLLHKKSRHITHSPDDPQPSWTAISNDYTGYVQTHLITPTIGRVTSLDEALTIQHRTGQTTSLKNIAAIVLATGFTPSTSLSFLPEDILHTLEHAPQDPFLPLILDGKGTSHANIPNLGFVGVYKGPYWGVMEMQARYIAEKWSREDPPPAETIPAQERQRMRRYRLASADSRGQFPMADYVGLMESFAGDLRIPRLPIGLESGPVIPSRYVHSSPETIFNAESHLSINALRNTLSPDQKEGLASTVFAGLHGTWSFSRTCAGNTSQGTASFCPVYPSPGYEREYAVSEGMSCSRFGIAGDSIHVSNGGETHSHELGFWGRVESGREYVVRAGCVGCEVGWVFRLEGVDVVSWEWGLSHVRTVYC